MGIIMKVASCRKLLVLSVGYGQGHHSAAAALAEYYDLNGWKSRVVDICAEAQPGLFRLTQLFYEFCVRRAPWLWGVTYSLTDTADWAAMVRRPVFRSLVRKMKELLHQEKPDFIFCTYPLFAYLLDELKLEGEMLPPYAMVVTDAREISRPWMRSEAPLLVVPDEGSRQSVIDRYALSTSKVLAAGFPVRRAFAPSQERGVPDYRYVNILYGAYRRLEGVVEDVRAMLSAFPQARLTVLAGKRADALKYRFRSESESGRLSILAETNRMAELLSQAHIYIGKAGAATMFECYASHVPMLVNFTLPGQEQGNLELLLEDGAGYHVESTAHLIATLRLLLQSDAARWKLLCDSMKQNSRSDGVIQIGRAIQAIYHI